VHGIGICGFDNSEIWGINNGCAYSQDKLRNLGRISVVKAVQTIPLFFFHEKKQVSTGSAYAIG
jgi:hypothetical protein